MEDESGNVKLATFSSGFVDKSNPILMEPGFNFFEILNYFLVMNSFFSREA